MAANSSSRGAVDGSRPGRRYQYLAFAVSPSARCRCACTHAPCSVLRLSELMSAIPVAFALMPQRLQGAGPSGGRCIVQQRCAERLDVHVLRRPRAAPIASVGYGNGIVPKASVDQQVDRLDALNKLTDFLQRR